MSYLPTNTVFNTTAPAPANGSQTQLQGDSTGGLYVNAEGRKATYRAGQSYSALPSGVVFVISGSATKLVKVTHIRVSATQATAGTNLIYVIKSSSLPTGGVVGAAMSSGPLDSADAAKSVGTGPQVYSTAATEGTRVCIVDLYSGLIPSPTVGNAFTADFYFGVVPGAKEITLRGTSEGVILFLNTAVVAGANTAIDIVVEWTEE